MALKENELRIGNYVKGIAMGLNHKIDLHFFNECYDDETMLDWYSPIPLTEQVLLDLGFKDSGTRIVGSNDQIEWRLEDGTIIEKSFGSLEYVLESDDWGSTQKSITLKSVHQLQNLHFALTETEITYNPTT